jgi:hypothetical protein
MRALARFPEPDRLLAPAPGQAAVPEMPEAVAAWHGSPP